MTDAVFSLLWLTREKILENGCLVLTQFMLHVEKCMVIGVFRIAAVLVLITGAFVHIIEDVIGRYGLSLILVKALIEQFLAGH